MKVNDLTKLNRLAKISGILLNNNIDNDFYDYYFEHDLSWLFDNEKKIEKDFQDNINKLKFDVILNSNLDERTKLILSINDIEEFSNYISIVPFSFLKKRTRNKISKLFDEFMTLDNYEKVVMFDRICRK